MKMKKLKVVLLLVAVAATVFAQSIPTGSVTGVIRDAVSHVALKDVKVNLKNRGKLISSSATNASGQFDFKNVSVGTYSLEAISSGYDTLRMASLHVTEGNAGILHLELKPLQHVVTASPFSPANELNDEITSSPPASGYSMKKESLRSDKAAQNGRYAYTWTPNPYPRPCCPPPMPPLRPQLNTEEYQKIDDSEFKDAIHNPLSTFSIDVDVASYGNVRRFITQGSLPPKDAVRIEEMVNYFKYDYPQPEGHEPFSVSTEISTCPWNAGHRLIHIGLQAKHIAAEDLPASNLVFLIDISGSMDEPNKLPLLKKAFGLLVNQLRAKDRVAIVVYASTTGVVLSSTPGDEKERILDAIDNLHAGGSTAGGAGIQLAYKIARENYMREGNNRIILATDGDFNVGPSSDDELVKMIEERRDQGVFLTVLGFGMGNYKDSKMEKLADKGNGNYAYIDNILEANKVFVKELGGTLNTLAKDVKLQVEFNPGKEKGYRLIGYEDRALASEDFNNDRKDAGELGAGHSVTAMYEIIPAGSEENINGVDPLKYQKNADEVKPTVPFSNELMTVKFRYKEPKGDNSKLITHPVIDNHVDVKETSDNFRFAAAVAEFGMLLRDSRFKSNSSYKDALALARSAKGKDHDGYRAEFIRLVETAELLSKGSTRVVEDDDVYYRYK